MGPTILNDFFWFALGSVVSWWITRRRAKRSMQELRALVARLPDQLLEVVKGDERRKLSFEELAELLWERGYPTPYGFVPNECPECGHDRFNFTSEHSEHADDGSATCRNCGWRAY